ncbi:MAG: acyl-CoA dehydrogenase family protein [Chloroflexota bacterium]
MTTLTPAFDLNAIEELAQKVDLNKLVNLANQLDANTLQAMLKNATKETQPQPAPPINSDFYDIYSTLTDEQLRVAKLTRDFFEGEIRPIINPYWERGEFPKHIIPRFAEYAKDRYGEEFEFVFPEEDPIAAGVAAMEMARGEPSSNTFFGVHWYLSMASIYMFGSDEQKAKLLPPMKRFEKIGSWALTEPKHGSDASAGLETTATKDGDTWILNGEKKWSGNASFADINIIWARNTHTGQVNGFIVELGQPGYHVEKLPGKIAKRAVENVLIKLENVEVHDSNRLPKANHFGDVARQLAAARTGVAWEAVGVAMGAYEETLKYTNNRIQFGKPLTSFQMVQHGLVKMLGHVTAMQGMMLQLARIQARDGKISHERASLAKAWTTEQMREVVAIGRGLLGGNGILLEHEVARFFADAEAVYSYEGTYEMNTLIVGKAITGQSAFV